jgi:hypothetical protein
MLYKNMYNHMLLTSGHERFRERRVVGDGKIQDTFAR